MGKLKLSKSVTLTMDNVLVIEQMMEKTKQNFSKTLNYVLSDWVKIRTELAKAGRAKQNELDVSKKIKNIKKAKVIKE